MKKDDLDIYSMLQLVDLFIKTTKELLDLMNNTDKDSQIILEKRRQVQMFQEAINQRKVLVKSSNSVWGQKSTNAQPPSESATSG